MCVTEVVHCRYALCVIYTYGVECVCVCKRERERRKVRREKLLGEGERERGRCAGDTTSVETVCGRTCVSRRVWQRRRKSPPEQNG